MIIQQTNLNIVYPRISEYRKKLTNAEELLKPDFMPSMVLPVPDQVQDEVPRVIVQTNNGHSVLNVALSVASFTTNYDGDFPFDWSKCKHYLSKRCSNVYKFIDNMTAHNNIFVGLITNVEIDDLDDTGLNVLKSSLCKEQANKMGEIHDMSYKLTYIYDKHYYINITLQNMREYSTEQCNGGRVCILDEKKHTVSVSIDINDRYAANNNANYKSTVNAFNDLLEITGDIIEHKLENLVKKGEFCI